MKTFVLVLQKLDAEYNAALHADDLSAAPLASHTFTVDVDEVASRFRTTPGGDPLLKIGQDLYDLVAPALDPYLEARANDESVRLLLKIHDPGLNSLPWELLLNDKKPLFRDPAFPMCRLQPQELDSLDLLTEHDWPLRIVIVVGSEAEDPAVDADNEVAQIVDALVPYEAAIDWQIVVRPAYEQLLATLANFAPHIFHFIGHGAINEDGDEPLAVLRIHDEQAGKNYEWDAVTLRDDLIRMEVDSLRLAFVNACRTSEEVGDDGLWSLTDAFLDAGAVAVIGTRAVITGSAAARCAAVFYREFVRDMAIDVAMARARAAVQGLKLRAWSTMSLELRLPPLDLFLSCMAMHEDQDQIRRDYWEVCKFVGRKELYRRAWEARLAEKKRPAVIKGPNKVGKTSAAKMLLERCLLADHVARYVDVSDIDKMATDYVDLMGATLLGVEDAGQLLPHAEPFPAASLDAFDDLVAETLGENLENRARKNVRKLFDGFREIVEQAYPDKPILLMYDHLDSVENKALKITISHFARWLREGARVHTLLIVAPHKEEMLRATGVNFTEPGFAVLPMSPFAQERYADLAAEFARRLVIARQVRDDLMLDEQKYEAYKQDVLPVVSLLGAQPNWTPDRLDFLEQLIVTSDQWPSDLLT